MNRLIWFVLAVFLLLGCLLQPSAALFAGLGGCLLLPLFSWGLLWPARKQIRLQMEAPSVTEKGGTVVVCIGCSRGWLPTGRVSAVLTVENAVTGEVARTKLLLCKEQNAELKSDFCGCLRCSLEKVRLWDFCGLLPVPLACGGGKRVLVMPDTFPVQVCMDTAPTQSEDCQEYAQDRKGNDRTETYQLREYVAGDSLSQIHWKLSSKRGHLVVREASCPVDSSLMLFVDRTWGTVSPAQADAIMEAAVSIGQALTEQAIPFRLCWNEDTIHSRDVNEQKDFPEAVAALLKSPMAVGISGSSLYLHTCGVPTAGRMIYLGTQPPEDAFVQAVPCKVLLCGEGQDSFTPETAAQMLQILSWS